MEDYWIRNGPVFCRFFLYLNMIVKDFFFQLIQLFGFNKMGQLKSRSFARS